jgi:hypothetical protein
MLKTANIEFASSRIYYAWRTWFSDPNDVERLRESENIVVRTRWDA